MFQQTNQSTHGRWTTAVTLSLLALLLLSACQNAATPTASPTAETEAVAAATEEPLPTWTPVPVIVEAEPEEAEPTLPPPPTSTAVPTSTPVTPSPTPTETATASPTPTAEATATRTPAPQPTAPPAANPTSAAPAATAPPAEPTAPPQLGVNLLPNASFEEGHYNQDGVPELQLPVGWRIEWDTGPTGVGTADWDVFVRPEARVLSTAFLPPEEHAIYIYNGQHTVKIFKGGGAVSFRLLTDVTLEPGTYVIEAKMFADIVERWDRSVGKIWSADPSAAEFRFLVGDGASFWTGQRFGQVNVHNYTFTVDQPGTITVGIALRAKYAIANNGWFIDDLSLRRVE